MKKYFLSLIIFSFIGIFTACSIGNTNSKSSTIENDNSSNDVYSGDFISLDNDLIALSGMTEAELSDFFKNWEDEYIKGTQLDNGSFYIFYDQEKLDDINGLLTQELSATAEKIEAVDPSNTYTVSTDFTSITIKVTPGTTDSAVESVAFQGEFYAALYQLFNETKAEDWNVEVDVYNVDTDMLISSCDKDSSLDISNSTWQASYPEDVFIYTMGDNYWDAVGITKDTFLDYLKQFDESFITIDYREESSGVIVAFDDKATIEKCLRDNFDIQAASFAALGDNYSLKLSDDFSSLTLTYDKNLDNTVLAKAAATAVLDSRIYQDVVADESDFSLDITIINATNGEIADSYNLPNDNSNLTLIGQDTWY